MFMVMEKINPLPYELDNMNVPLTLVFLWVSKIALVQDCLSGL